MQRIVLTKNNRDQFFNNLLKRSKTSLDSIATQYNISGRTLRDWRRGKFLPSLETLKAISKDFRVKIPPFKVLPQYWYITSENIRKAALTRMILYGPPGTPEGRKKGGLISQQNRKENPEYYRKIGCRIAKKFKPLKRTKYLAELFGVLLGDGSITQNQVKITLNKKDDREYGQFVKKLIFQEFGEEPSLYKRESVFDYMLSGASLVTILESFGLRKGNKIKNQVDIPKWILKNKMFALSCLRGLIDTDGGVYTHNHVVGRKRYLHFGLCFTSASRPMLNSVHKIFLKIGIKAKMQKEKRIYIYDMKELLKYFKIVGSNNPKHKKRLEEYLKIKRQEIITH